MKITYYAANDSMGDTSDAGCDFFRAFAKAAILNEFPSAEVEVVNKPASNCVRCDADDYSEYESVQMFCSELWDRCDWSGFVE